MRVAVTYEAGQIFQHFGKTEAFKVYEVENNQVISAEVMGTNGQGHSALANLLNGSSIDVLICGGIGGGAQQALASVGIQLVSGIKGDCDEAVARYLAGELTSAGVTCDHHDHEEGHECHCGEHGHEEGHECHCAGGQKEEPVEEECSGSCGSCGGGCGGGRILYEGPNAGKIVRVHYKGTFDDGSTFDSSYDRGEPLEFVCAVGMMIPGFDKAVVDMTVGQELDIHLTPDEAYGEFDPMAIYAFRITDMPGSENLYIGQYVFLQDDMGRQIRAKVIDRNQETITFDTNHELAGKCLNFHVELVEIVEE